MTRITGNPLDPLYKHNRRDMNKLCQEDDCNNYALWDKEKKRFRTFCAIHAKGPRYSKDILADPTEV
jgi:hypothetical protein